MKIKEKASIILLLFGIIFIITSKSIGYGVENVLYKDSSHDDKIMYSISFSIENTTVWTNINLELNESIKVEEGGNLTIINSNINFTNSEFGFEVNNSILNIENSRIFSGGRGIEGETNGMIILKNVSFSDFSDDVINLEGDYSVVIDASLFENNKKDAVQLADTMNFANISNSWFINNNKDAFNIEGVFLYIENCNIDDHEDEGIQFDGPGSISVKDTIIRQCGANGIRIRGYEGVALLNNVTLQDCAENGIQISEGETEANITDCFFLNNGKDGLNIEGVELYVDNCNFSGQGDEGIQFDGPGSIIVKNTIISNIAQDGIKIRDYNGTALIENVKLENCGDDGLQITEGETIVILRNSTAKYNMENGFEIDTANFTEISDCSFYGNGVHGIGFLKLGDVAITNSTLRDNDGYGIYGANSTNLRIESSNVRDNAGDGINLYSIEFIEIESAHIYDNRGTSGGSNGITIHKSEVIVNNSKIEGNSGLGIKIDQSNATIFNNTISSNEGSGLSLFFNSSAYILNNTIMNNDGNGIYFDNTTIGTVNYNIIMTNQQWGIYAEERTDNRTIDANNNYWGSNSGPALHLILDGEQDEYQGPINVTFILSDDQTIILYKPPTIEDPSEMDYRMLFLILAGIITMLVTFSFSYGIFLRNKWKNQTHPQHLLLLTTESGLLLVGFSFKTQKKNIGIVSGFISAINTFCKHLADDSVKLEGSELEEIKHQNITILLRVIGKWSIALIMAKSNLLVRRRLQRFVNDVLKTSLLDTNDEILKLSEARDKEFAKLATKHFADFPIDHNKNELNQKE